MARQRRGGGLRTPELKGTLGTLLRTTREVLERGAREGRERLDEALAGRRRDEALAELGEIVLDLIRRGEIDAAELPEVREVVARLDELDEHEPPRARRGVRASAAPPATAVEGGRERERFDRRRGGRDADDGTVSASTWAPPNRAKKGGAPAPAPDAPAAPAARAARGPAGPAARPGGISFEDEDLADYMHPDDVPPKDKP